MDKKYVIILRTASEKSKLADIEAKANKTATSSSCQWTFDTVEEVMDKLIEIIEYRKTLLKFDDPSDVIFRCTTYGSTVREANGIYRDRIVYEIVVGT